MLVLALCLVKTENDFLIPSIASGLQSKRYEKSIDDTNITVLLKNLFDVSVVPLQNTRETALPFTDG